MSEHEVDFVWVEVELLTNEDCDYYNCRMSRSEYEQIAFGLYEKPFIRVFDVHWYSTDEGDDDWKSKNKKELVHYGKGNKTEYESEALLRVSNILAMFVLKHGPKDIC
jgi:hypothetical protein